MENEGIIHKDSILIKPILCTWSLQKKNLKKYRESFVN